MGAVHARHGLLSCWPTTFGTVSIVFWPGPLETLICTWLWYGTFVPDGFACASTVPSSSVPGHEREAREDARLAQRLHRGTTRSGR